MLPIQPSPPTHGPCGSGQQIARPSPAQTVKLVGGPWARFLEPIPLKPTTKLPSPDYEIGPTRPINQTNPIQVNIEQNCVYFNQIVYILIKIAYIVIESNLEIMKLFININICIYFKFILKILFNNNE